MTWRLTSPKFLKGHWPLNGNIEDAVGPNNGAWDGTAVYSDGPFGKQIGGAFTAARIDISDNAALRVAPKMSVSCFMIPYLGGGGTFLRALVKADDADNYYAIAHADDTGEIRFTVKRNTVTYAAPKAFLLPGPSYVTMSFDGSAVIGYVNGVLATGAESSVGTSGDTDLQIGGVPGGQFVGNVWEVKKHDCALTYDEHIKLYRMARRGT
ncbi:MAG: LamG-like jellyroll fold domain-containing protein [Candidatus Heimdallarchaeaceae archaeon]